MYDQCWLNETFSLAPIIFMQISFALEQFMVGWGVVSYSMYHKHWHGATEQLILIISHNVRIICF